MRKLVLLTLTAAVSFAVASTASALSLSMVNTSGNGATCGADCTTNDGASLDFDLYITTTPADTGIDGVFLSVGWTGGVTGASGVEATLFSALVGITGTAGFLQPILPGVGPAPGAGLTPHPCYASQCTQYDYQSTAGSFVIPGASTYLGSISITMDGAGSGVVSFGTITPGLDSIQQGATSLPFSNATHTIQGGTVPEPAIASLMALGLVGLAISGRRR